MQLEQALEDIAAHQGEGHGLTRLEKALHPDQVIAEVGYNGPQELAHGGGKDGLVQNRDEAVSDHHLAVKVKMIQHGVAVVGTAQALERGARIVRLEKPQMNNESGGSGKLKFLEVVGIVFPYAFGIDVDGPEQERIKQQGGEQLALVVAEARGEGPAVDEF